MDLTPPSQRKSEPRFSQSPDPVHWKRKLCSLWNGWDICVVDGEYVRDHFYADWVEGGNFMRYPTFIPKGEIWIEELQTVKDTIESLVHEIVETMIWFYKIVPGGYDPDHASTNSVSAAVRKVSLIGTMPFDKIVKLQIWPKESRTMAKRGDAKP